MAYNDEGKKTFDCGICDTALSGQFCALFIKK